MKTRNRKGETKQSFLFADDINVYIESIRNQLVDYSAQFLHIKIKRFMYTSDNPLVNVIEEDSLHSSINL